LLAARWWLVLALMQADLPLAAQSTARLPARPPAPLPARLPGSELTISLMTMGVGARVWELFGHNAILVEDHARGTARAYNYGMFDFRQENFLLRFIQGRMWYWMQGFDLGSTVEIYRRANRSVWVQELNLSPAERTALRDFLEWNERPENRFYRYDYYRDNCSTRVRDALDRVLHGRLRVQTDTIRTHHTYRFHTARLTASDPLLYTGLQVGLGEPADRPLSAWDEMFLPLELRTWIRQVTVLDPSGREIPLVRSERTLFLASQPPPPETPPHWLLGYLVVGAGLGACLAWLGSRAANSGAARRAFGGVAWVWVVLTGVAGGILVFLWAFTDHAVAYRNENLFQANLLPLPLLLLVPALLRGGAWARHPAVSFAALLAASSLLGAGLKIFPGFSQDNLEVLALALPANLGLAAGVAAFTRRLKA